MAGVVGRAFKIKKNQAKGYGYVKPGKHRRNGKYRSNPGVTTIAAINGRGSYRTARASMRGLSKNARVSRARSQLNAAEKKAFAARLRQARHAKNIGRMGRKRKPLRRNARAAAPVRRRRVSPGVHAANRRKTTTMKRNKRKSPALAANKRRRRRKSSKRRLRANKGTSAGAKKGWRTRRRRKAGKKTSTKKRRRRRKVSASATPKRRRRKRKLKANARKSPRRRRRKARRRTTSRRRKSSKKRSRKARASSPKRRRRRRKASAKKMTTNRRRRARRNPRRNRRSLKSNRRRRHRRNGRSLFRRNSGLMGALKTGALIFGGFAAQRVLSNLFDSQVMSRLLPAPAAVTPAATSGLDALAPYSKMISSVLVAGIGSFVTAKVVKDEKTRGLLIGGFVLSALHTVVMGVLNKVSPSAANMLAGPEDGTAARLSAMYGLGHGASIMPRYGVINGVGEYFTNPVNGVGEYFTNPVNGVGEYLAVQGMQGLGTYEKNPNLLEAAAGMGQYQEVQGTHVDPSGDLDRQLTIAEAAAGVGALSPFEAAAGVQPFEASAGMGAVVDVPSSSTWIPGSSDPQLWAGVRPINRPQAATEMVPAGILQTDGGQGIFG